MINLNQEASDVHEAILLIFNARTELLNRYSFFQYLFFRRRYYYRQRLLRRAQMHLRDRFNEIWRQVEPDTYTDENIYREEIDEK